MRSSFWRVVLGLLFFAVPIGFLRTQLPIVIGGGPALVVAIAGLSVGFVLTIASLVFFGLAVVSMVLRGSRPTSLDRPRRETTYTAIAAGLLVPPVAFMLGLDSPLYALVYAMVAGFYVLFTVPESRRRVVYRSTINVRCTPEAAFALVSNAHNWPRYELEVEVLEPVDTPLRVGSIVNERMKIGERFIDGADQVTLMEPNRKFGTRAVGAPSEDMYEFRPIEEGTEISIEVQHLLTIPQAVTGGVLTRGAFLKKILSRREKVMQRQKQILEAPAAAT